MHFCYNFRYLGTLLELNYTNYTFLRSPRQVSTASYHKWKHVSKIITKSYLNLNHEISWSSYQNFLIPKSRYLLCLLLLQKERRSFYCTCPPVSCKEKRYHLYLQEE